MENEAKKIKALELGKYYRYEVKETVYFDKAINSEFNDYDLFLKDNSETDLIMLKFRIEALNDYKIFVDDDFESIMKKKPNEIISFLETEKEKLIKTYDDIINKYKDVKKQEDDFKAWFKTLEKRETVHFFFCRALVEQWNPSRTFGMPMMQRLPWRK